jgi:proline dehydrogenase
MVDFKDTQVAFERKTNRELKNTAWLFKMMNSPFLVDTGSSLTLLALKMKLPVKGAIKQTIFKQFCGGTTFEECKRAINELAQSQVATILDYGAEGKESEAAFEVTVRELTDAVQFAAKHATVPVITCKVTGVCRNHILEAVTTALDNGTPIPDVVQKEFDAALVLLDKLAKAAYDNHMALYIDAEESWIQSAIDEATDIMMGRYNQEKVTVYNTFQMYRHDRLDFLKKSFERARKGNYILGAKLVRGAYMEKERERAREKGYPSPIQPNKAACDQDYNAAVKFCVDNHTQIASCVASHNEYSNRYQIELMEEQQIPKDHPHLNFCQLYGMSDNLTFNLANAGFNAGKYTPYGPVEDVIPYLIRRARENSSVDGELSRELSLVQEELRRRKLS